MILDSGTMFICELLNTAENGRMPIEVLNPINKHWYQERTIGMSRQYMAQGVNERVDLLAYVHFDPKIRAGMYAVLGNGEQFIIRQVSHIIEENTNLRYTNISCQRLDQNYNVQDWTRPNVYTS